MVAAALCRINQALSRRVSAGGGENEVNLAPPHGPFASRVRVHKGDGAGPPVNRFPREVAQRLAPRPPSEDVEITGKHRWGRGLAVGVADVGNALRRGLRRTEERVLPAYAPVAVEGVYDGTLGIAESRPHDDALAPLVLLVQIEGTRVENLELARADEDVETVLLPANCDEASSLWLVVVFEALMLMCA